MDIRFRLYIFYYFIKLQIHLEVLQGMLEELTKLRINLVSEQYIYTLK